MASNSVTRFDINVSYLKCLRNHATNSTVVVLDGCGEFAPSGEEGTTNFTVCAACGCHRSFHKRVEKLVSPFKTPIVNQFINDNSSVAALPAPSQTIPQPRNVNEGKGKINIGAEKRVRTTFSPRQKHVMKTLADRVGWTLRNCNEKMIMYVCSEIGITRIMFKNWINTHRKKMMPGKQSIATQVSDVINLQN